MAEMAEILDMLLSLYLNSSNCFKYLEPISCRLGARQSEFPDQKIHSGGPSGVGVVRATQAQGHNNMT